MNYIKNWFLKAVLGNRVVTVVNDKGESFDRCVKYTEGKKAFVKITPTTIGFLDNPLQHEGEFRSKVSAPGLVRWFDI